ncbi:MAG: hypothetical protein IJM76_11330 [Lachnospiraceae bacterium]|nr:hypothetical protein [Lachnospiraceae bacterium]
MPDKTVRYILTPKVADGKISAISVLEILSGKCFEPEEAFSDMEKALGGCLSAWYGDGDIFAEDALGDPGIVMKESDGIRTYAFERKTAGNVTLKYSASVFPLFHWPNPALSLHNRSTGATGFADTFLLNPFGVWDYTIEYDETEIPGTVSACSYGIGTIEKEPLERAAADDICFAFGAPYRFNNGGKLNILYFENDLRFMGEITRNISAYFDYMDRKFSGPDKPYFIFLYRKDKVFNIDLTGTASQNVCLMGYGDALVDRYKDVESTIVHELVHNFLYLDEENAAYASFFSEGTADYFSIMIPFLLGANDREATMKEFNRFLRFYYSNPRKETSLEDAYEKSWTHSYAARVIYGKGLVFMMTLEALLKEHHSEKALIDIMSDLIVRQKKEEVSLRDFLDTMDAYTAGGSSQCFLQLSGEAKAVPPSRFIEGYHLARGSVRVEDNGFDETVAFSDPKVVTGIRAESNAYKAGLRNGDVILNKIDEWTLGWNEEQMAVLNVKRDGRTLEVRYLARGEETCAFHYEKDEGL